MLQTLLAERFQVKLHRETKELPVYVLGVSKAGAKLTESVNGPERAGRTARHRHRDRRRQQLRRRRGPRRRQVVHDGQQPDSDPADDDVRRGGNADALRGSPGRRSDGADEDLRPHARRDARRVQRHPHPVGRECRRVAATAGHARCSTTRRPTRCRGRCRSSASRSTRAARRSRCWSSIRRRRRRRRIESQMWGRLKTAHVRPAKAGPYVPVHAGTRRGRARRSPCARDRRARSRAARGTCPSSPPGRRAA